MKIKSLALITALSTSLVACGGGDIVVDAQSVDNSTDNSVSNSNNTSTGSTTDNIICAEYTSGGVVKSGQSNGTDCIYSESFVNFDEPLTESITLGDIGEGAHIFQGSLFVGQNYGTLAEAAAEGITKGGDGPSLTIEAGVTVAFAKSNSFLAVMRGSQIFANGTAAKPITFTSVADYQGNVGPEDVQSWGGMILNGFAFTNACQYDAGWTQGEVDGDDNLIEPTLLTGTDCSIAQEGTEGDTENHYGGTVVGDNSGSMTYAVVKHAGFDLLPGNELNGINLGAIGSGTTLENIEVYANSDDGVEFFGGSVDLTNYVALYVRDDSIDIDQGYYGTITNALVIQGGGVGETTKTGAHCVESDGSASSTKADNITKGYTSKATINNLTCIISAKGPSVAGNSDPGAGINAEEGHHLTLNDSIVTTAYAVDSTIDGNDVAIDAGSLDYTNYCFQLEDDEDLENAGNGLINITDTVFACHDISASKARTGDFTIVPGTVFSSALTGQQFLEDQMNLVALNLADDGSTPPNAGDQLILDGFYSVPVADMLVDGVSVGLTTQIGAVTANNDWTASWTYGLHEESRGQALWFE